MTVREERIAENLITIDLMLDRLDVLIRQRRVDDAEFLHYRIERLRDETDAMVKEAVL